MTVTVGTRHEPGTTAPSAPPSGEPAPQAPSASGSQDPNGDTAHEQRRVEIAEEELNKLRSELETATATRIPDLQRQIADAQKERDDAATAARKAEGLAREVHQSWIEWARQELPPELWKRIEGHESERTGKALRTQAELAESYQLMNEAYESGDADFARFLKRQHGIFTETGQGRITRAALPHLRSMFDELKGGKVNGQQPNTSTSTTPSGGQQPPTPTPAPPKVPPPGGPAQPGGEPAYKAGDSPTTMWQRVFKGRGQARPPAGT